MQRFLLLFLCFAGAASAQLSTGCDISVENTNTHVDTCLASADAGSPLLQHIDPAQSENGLPTYTLYAQTLGAYSTPSICIGTAEPYSPITNTFLDPATLTAGSQVSWVYVCRPVTLFSSWKSQSGAIIIGLQAPFSMATNPAIPPQYQAPLVMMTNNDTGKTTANFYYTAPTVAAANDPVTVSGVTSLGAYPGSGLQRYQINGSAFGKFPPRVQLYAAQTITQDAIGTVLTETPVTSTTSMLTSQGTTVWLPIAQQPQVVEFNNVTVQIQMPLQPVSINLTGSPSTSGPSSGTGTVSGQTASNAPVLAPPVTRGYVYTNSIGGAWYTPFNFNQ